MPVPVHTPAARPHTPKPDSAMRCQALWLAWAVAEAETDTYTIQIQARLAAV